MIGTTVFVQGIPKEATEQDIRNHFSYYGKVRVVLFKIGYIFVEFDKSGAAVKAVKKSHTDWFRGRILTVEISRTPYYENFLIVKNLSKSIGDKELMDHMRQAGRVSSAFAHDERSSQGIVHFPCHSDLITCFEELDGTELGGRKIRLQKCSRFRRRSPRSFSRSKRNHYRNSSSDRSNSPKMFRTGRRYWSPATGPDNSRSGSPESQRVISPRTQRRSRSRYQAQSSKTRRDRSRSISQYRSGTTKSQQGRFNFSSKVRYSSQSKSRSLSRSSKTYRDRSRPRSKYHSGGSPSDSTFNQKRSEVEEQNDKTYYDMSPSIEKSYQINSKITTMSEWFNSERSDNTESHEDKFEFQSNDTEKADRNESSNTQDEQTSRKRSRSITMSETPTRQLKRRR